MTNAHFTRLDQFQDIETQGQHDEVMVARGSLAEFLAGANANARDHTCTPMQWTDGDWAGFSDTAAWMTLSPNYPQINVAVDRAEPDGVFGWYQRLIALRKAWTVITTGRFEMLLPVHPSLTIYLREDAHNRLLVIGSYARNAITLPQAVVPDGDWELLMANVPHLSDGSLPDVLPLFFAGVWIAQHDKGCLRRHEFLS